MRNSAFPLTPPQATKNIDEFTKLDSFGNTRLGPLYTYSSHSIASDWISTPLCLPIFYPHDSCPSFSIRLTTPPFSSPHCFWFLSIYFLLDFGWSNVYGPKYRRQAHVAMVSIGAHSIMRVIETCFVSLWDGERPQWVMKPSMAGADEQPHNLVKTPEKKSILPLPTNSRGKLIYSLDLISSYRGNSWFSDRVWSWSPRYILLSDFRPTRKQFLLSNIFTLFIQYIAIDALEAYAESQQWDQASAYPITSLPLARQIPGAFCVFLCMITQLSLGYIMGSIFFVALGAPPSSWPPMFISPLGTTSLTSFWTYRWQQNFRRSFIRLTQGILYFIPRLWAHRHPIVISNLRRIVVFVLSATLHLIFLSAIPPYAGRPKPAFLDSSVLWFFLSQPVGIVVESVFVVPLAGRILPESQRYLAPKFFLGLAGLDWKMVERRLDITRNVREVRENCHHQYY